jgi:hypothetical protein
MSPWFTSRVDYWILDRTARRRNATGGLHQLVTVTAEAAAAAKTKIAAMFNTILAAKTAIPDLCATIGQCAAKAAVAKDIVSSATHVSTSGIYTADQVRKFRSCSNNYTARFDPYMKMDEKTHSQIITGYKPQGGKSGKDLVESFRMCWEDIKLQ